MKITITTDNGLQHDLLIDEDLIKGSRYPAAFVMDTLLNPVNAIVDRLSEINPNLVSGMSGHDADGLPIAPSPIDDANRYQVMEKSLRERMDETPEFSLRVGFMGRRSYAIAGDRMHELAVSELFWNSVVIGDVVSLAFSKGS